MIAPDKSLHSLDRLPRGEYAELNEPESRYDGADQRGRFPGALESAAESVCGKPNLCENKEQIAEHEDRCGPGIGKHHDKGERRGEEGKQKAGTGLLPKLAAAVVIAHRQARADPHHEIEVGAGVVLVDEA